MSIVTKRLAVFDKFTLDYSQHILFSDKDETKLPLLSVKVLEYLIDNRPRNIPAEELMEKCWPGITVSIDSIHKQISEIRRALGDSPGKPRFIRTLPKRGWQFISDAVEREDTVCATAAVVDVYTTDAQSPVHELVPLASVPPIINVESRRERQRRSLVIGFISLAIVAAAAIVMLAVPARPPRILQSTRLTWDGRPKQGPLLTDGKRILFKERWNGSLRVVSIPVSGGDPTPLNTPFPSNALTGMSRDGSTLLLLTASVTPGSVGIYPLSSASPRWIRSAVSAAALAPDGQKIALSSSSDLSIVSLDGSTLARASLTGFAFGISWSHSGDAVRFSLIPYRGSTATSEWEFDPRTQEAHRLFEISDGQEYIGADAWSKSGKHFFFESGHKPQQDLWVTSRVSHFLSSSTGPAQRLNNGAPGSWSSPVADPQDDKALFALNTYLRPELVKLDPLTKSWREAPNPRPILEVSYSPDSRWIAYVKLPEYSIWKSHPDGTAATRLTPLNLEARQPSWSPDGRYIAYTGQNGKGDWLVFRICTDGGTPEHLTDTGLSGVPTWSPDGRSLVFGERISKKSRSEMAIHVLDLKSKRVVEMPGTRGLWSPRWSPDGRRLLAITTDSEAISISDAHAPEWKELLRLRNIDKATWSPDSKFILFNGIDQDKHHWLYRLSIATGKTDKLASLEDFDYFPPDSWFGVDSDGSPLALMASRVDELFKLKCDLP